MPYDTSRYSASEAAAASMLLALFGRVAKAPPSPRAGASAGAVGAKAGRPLLPPPPPPRSAGSAAASGRRALSLPPPPARRAAGVLPPPPPPRAVVGAGRKPPPAPPPPRSPVGVKGPSAPGSPLPAGGLTPSSSSLSSGAGGEGGSSPPRPVAVKKRSRPPPPRASSPTGVVAVVGREQRAVAPPPKKAKKAGSGTGSPVGVPGSNESRRVQPSTEVACRVRDLGCPGGWTWILGTVVSYAPDVKKYYVMDAAADADAAAEQPAASGEDANPENTHPSSRRRVHGKRHAVTRKQLSILTAEPPVPHTAGSRVLAMYPDTTTFYPATIVTCPPPSPVSVTGATPVGRPTPRQGSYLLHFDDEDGESMVKRVAARYVTSLAARRTR